MEEENQDQSTRVLVEQLGRFQDRIIARMDRIEATIQHHADLDQERVTSIRSDLNEIRETIKDHEQRIRLATDGVTSFKTWAGLSSGGATLLSIITFIKVSIGL